MNLLGAWKKLVLFGLFGAAGCLAGCVVGQGYLFVADVLAAYVGAGQGPSLISKPSSPTTSEPPPVPTEFKDRLDKAGAHSGDVQISLIWFNTNDLDLHCIDPNNFEIFWRPENRRSASGGELDVDRNAGCHNPTVEPVENIYWPKGKAPMGKYQVYLDYYQRCGGAPNETRYKINVLHGTERKEFSGTIVKDDPNAEKRQLIYEFELAPRVDVAAPPEIQLQRGAKVQVPVVVRRSFFQGKLDLKAHNLPDGVTATTSSIETGQSEGAIELKATEAAAAGKKVHFKVVASTPEVSGSADSQVEVLQPAFSLIQTLITGIWTALLAVGLCLALLVGQNRYLGRPALARSRIPLAGMILGAMLAGFLSGSIGQSLYSLLLLINAGGLGFLVGWVLLGGLLGGGMSYFVPNLDRKKAMIAGLVGGLLGATGYLIASNAAEWLGRFAGAALLGFCIGLMVAIVEAAFRLVWLEVRFGEREKITVNLGPEPVKVGGDARANTVWARGAADVALRYFVREGKVICEDTPARKESVVHNGDMRSVGNVTLVVHMGVGAPAPRTTPRLSTLPSLPAPAPVLPPTAPLQPKPVRTEDFLPSPPPPGVPTARPAPPPAPAAPTARPPVPAGGGAPPKPPAAAPPPKQPAPPPAPKPAVPALGTTAKPPVPAVPVVPPKPPAPAAKPPVPVPGGAAVKPPPPAGAKPPAPATAPPKPPAPAASPPKPPVPAAGAKPPVPPPPTPAAPATGTAKPKDPDACPTCGRKAPGRPGARFCMMCDRAY
jgi:hypothetical protein